jgi:hypothetical protein
MQFGQLERSFLEDDLWSLYASPALSDLNEESEIRGTEEAEQESAAVQSSQPYPSTLLQWFRRCSQTVVTTQSNL